MILAHTALIYDEYKVFFSSIYFLLVLDFGGATPGSIFGLKAPSYLPLWLKKRSTRGSGSVNIPKPTQLNTQILIFRSTDANPWTCQGHKQGSLMVTSSLLL